MQCAKNKPKTKAEKIRILTITGIVIFILAILMTLPIKLPTLPLIVYNHTESLPVGWYIMIPIGKLKDGDIVGFDPPNTIKKLALERGWIKKDDVTMKKIGAMEGERYEIGLQSQFYVNGKYIGQAMSQDTKNRPMPKIGIGVHYVEQGRFLPITEHPLSFDGRYYGTVPLADVRFRAIQLFPF